MERPDRPTRDTPRRRCAPSIEGLEHRQLLSTASSSQAARVAITRHDYDQYVRDLKDVELHSQATPAQYLALRDDARSIALAASAAAGDRNGADARAVAVSLQLDRSLLAGSLGPSGWSEVESRLTTNLDALGVPRPLIDKTIADVHATAASAGVSAANYQTLVTDMDRYADARSNLSAYSHSTTNTGHYSSASSGYSGFAPHFPDPQVYYTQHLRGFFRGWAEQKVNDQAKLRADLTAAGGGAVLHRDTQALVSLGAAVPSETNGRLLDAYSAAFGQGAPTATVVSSLGANLTSVLGIAATPSRAAKVATLAADAPAFYLASGSSPANVATLVGDVRAVVDDGGDSSLNPFKITIVAAPRPARNG